MSRNRKFSNQADRDRVRIAKACSPTVRKPYYKVRNNPGRNDPCPCRSGVKYKKCCGAV